MPRLHAGNPLRAELVHALKMVRRRCDPQLLTPCSNLCHLEMVGASQMTSLNGVRYCVPPQYYGFVEGSNPNDTYVLRDLDTAIEVSNW